MKVNHIGDQCASRYIAHARVFEDRGRLQDAGDVYEEGIENNAQPMNVLKNRYRAFQLRSAEKIQAQMMEGSQQSTEAPSHSIVPLDTSSQAGFDIYVDPVCDTQSKLTLFNSWKTLPSKFAGVKENEAGISSWAGQKLPSSSLQPIVTIKPEFQVYQDKPTEKLGYDPSLLVYNGEECCFEEVRAREMVKTPSTTMGSPLMEVNQLDDAPSPTIMTKIAMSELMPAFSAPLCSLPVSESPPPQPLSPQFIQPTEEEPTEFQIFDEGIDFTKEINVQVSLENNENANPKGVSHTAPNERQCLAFEERLLAPIEQNDEDPYSEVTPPALEPTPFEIIDLTQKILPLSSKQANLLMANPKVKDFDTVVDFSSVDMHISLCKEDYVIGEKIDTNDPSSKFICEVYSASELDQDSVMLYGTDEKGIWGQYAACELMDRIPAELQDKLVLPLRMFVSPEQAISLFPLYESGSLDKLLQVYLLTKRTMAPVVAAYYIYECLSCVSLLHSHGCVHGKLTPSHFFIGERTEDWCEWTSECVGPWEELSLSVGGFQCMEIDPESSKFSQDYNALISLISLLLFKTEMEVGTLMEQLDQHECSELWQAVVEMLVSNQAEGISFTHAKDALGKYLSDHSSEVAPALCNQELWFDEMFG